MEIKFDGKKVLVTGAGKGIGRGLVLRLAECGADVVAISRTRSDLDELAQLSSKIQTLCLDISDWDKTEKAVNKLGPIHMLVNNAGVLGACQLLGNIKEKEIDEVIDINLKSIVNISQIVARGMIERKGGSIVNVSSIMAFGAHPTRTMYACSKGAVDQLTRNMAVEYGPHNIRVNSVNPTVVKTPMGSWASDPTNERAKRMLVRTPLGRFSEVDEVINPILFLLSDKASMVTGIVMPIDGGFTVSY